MPGPSILRCLRLTVLVCAGVLALSACDDGAPDVAPPAAVETCDGLVDIGDQLVRAYAAVLEQTDVGDLTAGVEDPNLTELGRIGDELDLRAASLGCDLAALNRAIVESTSDVEATSPAAEVFLVVVREGIVGGDADATTSSTEAP